MEDLEVMRGDGRYSTGRPRRTSASRSDSAALCRPLACQRIDRETEAVRRKPLVRCMTSALSRKAAEIVSLDCSTWELLRWPVSKDLDRSVMINAVLATYWLRVVPRVSLVGVLIQPLRKTPVTTRARLAGRRKRRAVDFMMDLRGRRVATYRIFAKCSARIVRNREH